MNSRVDFKWLDELELHGPAAVFADFCKTEVKRRSESDAEFSAATYEVAIRLVLVKLGAMDMDGMQ
ncbi:MAG: hypothetical protein DSZ28_01180 [Thiothrix sp.]|nr:MAG: hypothetical protein DSZ28_01180 [Thiothrix sp.]